MGQTIFRERINREDYHENIFHVTRYKFAYQFIQGKTVLDIACGTGFGSTLLEKAMPATIIGVDVDNEAVKKAHQSNENHFESLMYLVADAGSIPLPNLTIDVVLCIETIEHIKDEKHVINEFFRVLKEGGILVLTTPNAKITQPVNGIPSNPYHVREYTPRALKNLLSSNFSDVRLLGQRIRGTVDSSNPTPLGQENKLISRLLNIFPLELRQAFPKFLPPLIADWIVRQVTGHNFYLREEDIEFGNQGIDLSPVLFAVCRK